MKVVHLMGCLRPSGMERMLVSAAPHLRSKGVDSVVVGQGSEHPFSSQILEAGMRVVELPNPARTAVRRDLGSLLRRERPDVVHIHTEGAFAATVATVRVAARGVPILRTVHNVFQNEGRARVTRQLQARVADPFVDVFVAPSPDVAEKELTYGRQCSLIYNWVDDRFDRLRSERVAARHERLGRSVVIVGNSSRIKNQVLALEAIMSTDLQVYMHGDEEGASPRERMLLNRLEGEGRLRHRGVGDPAESLRLATAFVMPSLQEGMSVALAEAMTAGLPCFIADSPGLQWPKGLPGVTSLDNDLTSWRAAMGELASSTRALPWSVPAGNVNFSAARGAAEYFNLYESLFGGRTRRQD